MIYTRIAVLAAVKAARELYPVEEDAIAAVARELCIPEEAVSEVVQPEESPT